MDKDTLLRNATITVIFILLTGCVPGLVAPTTQNTPEPVAPTHTFTPPPVTPPTANPSPSPEPSPSFSPSPTSPPPSPTLPPGPLYAVVGVEANDVLNVRKGAGVSYSITGTIPSNGINIAITGKGKKIGDYNWVPVQYQETQGWVNKHFLAEQRGVAQPQLLDLGNQILRTIKEQNFSKLAGFVHPESCLRFSPYPTVKSEHQVFCQDKIRNLFSDTTAYTWGRYDGSGEPISESFSAYYQEFVYDVDFAYADLVGFNQAVGTGNAINNIHDFYPGSMYIEYHFPGFDPQYGGMDWRSIRLVFAQHDQTWRLVAIVHAEWTI